MEIIIEFGTLELKQQLTDELLGFSSIVDRIAPSVNISRIVVSSDFDGWVNKLQGTLDHKSTRRGGDLPLTAWARMIWAEDGGVSFVLSPIVYTEANDTQVRTFVYLHELTHVVNRLRFSKPSLEPTARAAYLTTAYNLFDEYRADRVAFKTVGAVFPLRSEYWRSFIADQFARFESLLNDPSYYALIEMEVASTRFNVDMDQFLTSIKPSIGEIAESTVHAFSIAHQYPEFALRDIRRRSKFVNEKTIALMDFFKAKYERGEYDLDDGLPLITTYMTNFGIMFQDSASGLQCVSLEI